MPLLHTGFIKLLTITLLLFSAVAGSAVSYFSGYPVHASAVTAAITPSIITPVTHIQPPRQDSRLQLVKLASPKSTMDRRNDYTIALMNKVLENTKEEFGPYQVMYMPAMSRKRQFSEMTRDGAINISDAPACKDWDKVLNPVFFPLRRGLQNYRLLMIHREDASTFANIKTLKELQAARAGTHHHWMNSRVLESANFTLVQGNDYEGLFHMLNQRRFDYFPRALNEVFNEYEARKKIIPALIIEPTKALNIQSPTFFYVSKKEEQLQARLEKGLWQLQNSGELQQFFNNFHNEDNYRAALKGRQIFKIDTTHLTSHAIYSKPELWFKI